ncbi:MAG: pyrroline-5-carboxylate reductase [Proteobacteria bacterium]|nr:pyrroline-5-carboxylate reductase [Pseudomonadota bacterium]
MKVVFIGGGNMATALISGLLEKGSSPSDFLVVDIAKEARTKFESIQISTAPNFIESDFNADVVVLAVKPQNLKEVVQSCASSLKTSLIVSIVAGIPIASVRHWLNGYSRIIRVMPNTPALIQAGVSGMYGDDMTRVDRELAENVMSCVGRYIWCQTESLIDVVTAISGSGPAYVFYFIEALEAVGIELGLDRDAAELLAVETFLGASRLAARSEESASALRERVTSKGGTTAAALASFDGDKLKDMIARGVRRARDRSEELAKEFGGAK